MFIGDLLGVDERIETVLMTAGMHCLGCPSSQMETLEEACQVHEIDVDVLVNKLNEYIA